MNIQYSTVYAIGDSASLAVFLHSLLQRCGKMAVYGRAFIFQCAVLHKMCSFKWTCAVVSKICAAENVDIVSREAGFLVPNTTIIPILHILQPQGTAV